MDNFVLGTIQENIKILQSDLNKISGEGAQNINDLDGVDVTNVKPGDILSYNGTDWVNNNLDDKVDARIAEASYTETDPVFTAHTTYNITNGTGFLKNNGSGTWSYDNNTYLTTANIYDLNGLTWANVDDNEVIRRSSSTSAEGAGMKLRDATFTTFPQNTYKKTISYFNRVSPLNIRFGAIDYEYSSVGYNQRIVPYSPILSTGTDGLYLNYDNTNTNVGINVKYPGKTFEVGTTLIVDDSFKRVGVNQLNPSVDLEVLNTMYVDSNTRRVGVVNATPTTTFQVGTTMYVNETNGSVGIGIANPTEKLEVDGSIQITSANLARLKFHQPAPNGHSLGEIDALQDGSSGGRLEFFTKEDGGSVTQKLIINNKGALGLGGTSAYGTPGQVLQSNGSGSTVSWANPVATTYTDGSNINITGTTINVISNPTFGSLTATSNTENIKKTVSTTNTDKGFQIINRYGTEIMRCVEYTDGAYLLLYNAAHTQNVYLDGRTGLVSSTGTCCSSDDRIKHNEKPITNALQTVRKLKPQVYDKGVDVKDRVKEAGFIAQEIQQIPELAYCVQQGRTKEDMLSLRYNDLFVYATTALQELDAIVQKQAQLISSLEARIKALESK